jgi:Skp family chaperone for outer membrane proteins
MKTSLFLFLAAFPAAAWSLEIPLKHRAEKGGAGGGAVGFVDMEAIFQEYPETKKAKAEYFAELAKRRQVLADREKELSDLREQLSVLRTTLKEMQEGLKSAPSGAASSTAAAPGGSAAGERPTAPGGSAAGERPDPAEIWTAESAAPAADEFGRPASLTRELGVSPGSVAAVNESLLQREKTLTEKEAELERARLSTVKELTAFEEDRSLQIMGKLYKALIQLAEEQGLTLVVDKRSILYGQAAMDLTERLRRRVRGLPDPEFDQEEMSR